MHRLNRLFLALALVMSVGGLTAGIIDFDGVGDTAVVGPLSSMGVTVNFYTGDNSLDCSVDDCSPGGELGDAYGAHPGAAETAFTLNDMRDGGDDSPFLTDEPDGPGAALDYFFTFDVGVLDLALQLLDYRDDGGPGVGGTATLQVYTSDDWDPANEILGAPFFTIPAGTNDGNVANLSIFPGASGPIRSARLTFSQLDVGTGVDNLEFTAVPEPGTVILFGTGLLALGTIVRKRRGAAPRA